jgi:von Willebrand factor A domain-containing protein 7
MKIRIFLSGIIMLFFLIVSDSSIAFIPGPPRSLVTSGKTHKDITYDALDEIYASYGYGPKGTKAYTKSMKTARDSFADMNAWVDYNEDKSAPAHCDGEQLEQCSKVISERVKSGLNSLVTKDDIDAARIDIGKALHTLQDFYSHSNWVELGHSDVNNEVGTSFISSMANSSDDTCIQENSHYVALESSVCNTVNLITSKLTSGYFAGTSGPPTGTGKKCNHGGAFDGAGYNLNGINKDATSCTAAGIFVAPHSDHHPVAANVAIKATSDLFNEIKTNASKYSVGKAATESQFKALLGFGPSLGFAIDTTGSMGGIISSVKSQVKSIIEANKGSDEEASRYVLAPFNDPGVSTPLVTADSDVFLAALDGLSASGGDDCPELSMAGLYNAVAKSTENSSVWLFTDASSKDAGKSGDAMALAESKKIKVFNALFGSCSPYDPAYFDTASRTGGQVFILNTSSEASKVTQLASQLAKTNVVDILSVAGTMGAAPVEYTFPVDSKTQRITVSVSLETKNTIDVIRPNGTPVSTSDPDVTVISLTSALVYSINTPSVGVWKVKFSGSGRYSANVTGESPLTFDSFDFVAVGGREGHTGYYPITGTPVIGKTQTVQAKFSGSPKTVKFELRTRQGTLINPFELTSDLPNNSEFSGDITLPLQSFVVYTVGTDSTGAVFQRVIGSQITTQPISIVPPSAVDLGRGQSTTYTFQVRNEGATDTFSFSAKDDNSYVTTVTPTNVQIETGKSSNVQVVLRPPLSTVVGSLDILTFRAQSTTLSEVSNSAVIQSKVIDSVLLGDVNRDGVVNCDDLNLVKMSFGKQVGQPAFNTAVDLDNNGIIDIRDLAVVARQVPSIMKCN